MSMKARVPVSITMSSRALVAITMFLLLWRSAKIPDCIENNKKGKTKTAPAKDVILLLYSAPFIFIKAKIMSILKTWSLRAPKNCVIFKNLNELLSLFSFINISVVLFSRKLYHIKSL